MVGHVISNHWSACRCPRMLISLYPLSCIHIVYHNLTIVWNSWDWRTLDSESPESQIGYKSTSDSPNLASNNKLSKMNFSINLFDNYQLLSIIFQIFRTFLKPLQAIDWHTFPQVVIELISLQPFHCWTFWPSACRLGKPQIGTTCFELIGLWIFSIFQVCVNPAAILQCSVTDFQCTSFNMHSSVQIVQCNIAWCTCFSVHHSVYIVVDRARPTLSHRCQKAFWNDLFFWSTYRIVQSIWTNCIAFKLDASQLRSHSATFLLKGKLDL